MSVNLDVELLTDARDGLNYLLERIETHFPKFFECDCDPSYETDTNAWIHDEDRCAAAWLDGLDATLSNIRTRLLEVLK